MMTDHPCPHCQDEKDQALKKLVNNPHPDCCQDEKNDRPKNLHPKSNWKKIISIFQKNA